MLADQKTKEGERRECNPRPEPLEDVFTASPLPQAVDSSKQATKALRKTYAVADLREQYENGGI